MTHLINQLVNSKAAFRTALAMTGIFFGNYLLCSLFLAEGFQLSSKNDFLSNYIRFSGDFRRNP